MHTTDGAIGDLTTATLYISNGAISLCAVVVVSCCTTDSSCDFVSIVISKSTRTALECVLQCHYSQGATKVLSGSPGLVE